MAIVVSNGGVGSLCSDRESERGFRLLIKSRHKSINFSLSLSKLLLLAPQLRYLLFFYFQLAARFSQFDGTTLEKGSQLLCCAH